MNIKYNSLAAVLVVAAGALAVPMQAHATVYSGGSASSLCKAAAGPGADVFYFDSLKATNTSGGVQYITCQIPESTSVGDAVPSFVTVHYSNPTAASKVFTCVLQAFHAGTAVANSVYNETVPANATHYVADYTPGSTPAVPVRFDTSGVYTMSCAIPAGASIDSIKVSWPGTIPA